jgi:hypothetical protein
VRPEEDSEEGACQSAGRFCMGRFIAEIICPNLI